MSITEFGIAWKCAFLLYFSNSNVFDNQQISYKCFEFYGNSSNVHYPFNRLCWWKPVSVWINEMTFCPPGALNILSRLPSGLKRFLLQYSKCLTIHLLLLLLPSGQLALVGIFARMINHLNILDAGIKDINKDPCWRISSVGADQSMQTLCINL